MLGKTVKLKVSRINEASYTLTDGKGTNITMYFNDALERYKEGQQVKVFIFMDSQKRQCATDHVSLLNDGEAKFLEIVDFNAKVGYFLDMGIKKHLLLSYDDLPDIMSHPEVGDKVLVRLKVANSGLFAKLLKKEDLQQYVKPTEKLEVGKKYMARVIKTGREGINCVTEDTFNHIFVHKLNMRDKYRIGQEVEVKVMVDKIGDYNGTLIEQKEVMMGLDKEILLKEIIDNGGMIPFDAKSDNIEIYKRFKMSKRAFKNALGNLYKERKVEFKDGKTYLVK